MHLPALDFRYLAVMSYVEGCDAATGYELLAGFNAWLGVPSIAWSSTIVTRRIPEFEEHGRRFSDLTAEEDAALIADLFDALDRFLTQDSIGCAGVSK
jgi:hypothetical protein